MTDEFVKDSQRWLNFLDAAKDAVQKLIGMQEDAQSQLDDAEDEDEDDQTLTTDERDMLQDICDLDLERIVDLLDEAAGIQYPNL